MKYFLLFFVIFASLSLTGCFEKKSETEILSEQEAVIELKELSWESEKKTENEQKMLQVTEETEKKEGENTPLSSPKNEDTQISAESNTPSSETIQEQQEIIQATEEDLEALFDDLLKGE